MSLYRRWKLKRALQHSDFTLAAEQIVAEFNGSVVADELAAVITAFVEQRTLDNAVRLVELEPDFLAIFTLCDTRLPEVRQLTRYSD